MGGQEAGPTDALVEETTHLIEHTWVMPVAGWPSPVDATPPMPPVPPPVPTAGPFPSPVAATPSSRRVWPILVGAAAVALVLGAVGVRYLLMNGEGADEDAGSTAPGPVTTVAPTTTTTEPPPPSISVTARLTLDANDFGDFFEQVLTGDAGCIEPEASVGLETTDGRVLVPPTAFPAGTQVAGEVLDACEYTILFAQVEGVDDYLVTLEDQEGEFEPAPISRDEIEAAGGLVDLNELFEVSDLVGPV